MIDPHDTRTLPLPQLPPATPPVQLVPAVLAGRCLNGYERDRGSVVHAVRASADELRFGIEAYARAICGKTHGARSAGWSHRPGAAITCPRCVRLAPLAAPARKPARPRPKPARECVHPSGHEWQPDWEGRSYTKMRCRWCGKREPV